MSQDLKIENNKLIAEFMGYTNISVDDPDFNFYKKKGEGTLEAMSMKYHSSWDWLMPVVEKIIDVCKAELICNTFFLGMSSFNIKVEKERRFHEFNVYFVEHKSRLNAVYINVISFIKWYNKQEA